MGKANKIFWTALACINLSTAIYHVKTVAENEIEEPKIVENYNNNTVTADETIKQLQQNSDETVSSLLYLPLSLATL
ncbi:MAG: hypothetical protein J6Q51_03595, partial [Clostridia bacterium]|nr:hypothetical protein [Clostridia bacterium]